MNIRIEGEWRETCSAFIEYLNEIKEQSFHRIDHEEDHILYIDSVDKHCAMDKYLQSYVSLFQSIAGIEKRRYCLVFLPEIDDSIIQMSIINQVMNKLGNRDILFLYREDIYHSLIDTEFYMYDRFKVTYNSRLNIHGFCGLEDYLYSLTSKQRHFLKRSIKTFESNPNVMFHKFDIVEEKDRVSQLYKECCLKHQDSIECDLFLEKLELAKQVDWYGVYDQEKLIMFSGCWKNTDSAIFGMFGKDYKKEQLIRDSYAYFAMNLKMIESAIHAKFDRIYNSFGERDIKKRMGYTINDYFLMVRYH